LEIRKLLCENNAFYARLLFLLQIILFFSDFNRKTHVENNIILIVIILPHTDNWQFLFQLLTLCSKTAAAVCPKAYHRRTH